MFFVVYKNEPRYKGADVFLKSATETIFTNNINDAKKFDTKEEAEQIAQCIQYYDNAHQKASVMVGKIKTVLKDA